MSTYAKITLGAVLLFAFGLFYVTVVDPINNISGSEKSQDPQFFYGRIVELAGDIGYGDDGGYNSGITLVRYVRCNRFGVTEFDKDSDAVKKSYSKLAIVANTFKSPVGVGDVVMIRRAYYKDTPEPGSLGNRYVSVTLALPIGSEPLPGF